MPPADLKLSVFCINGLGEREIWEIGNEHITSITSGNIYARGDIEGQNISSNALSIDKDNIPLRHANITGWPSQKEEQKAIALELARNSDLIIKPSSV
jgi:hypothetical protein